MLDWRITTFLDVCETLNYTRTAERLSITQPAVSQHITWLEKQTGARLFERKGRSLTLTQAGTLVHSALQAQKNNEALLMQELAALTSSKQTYRIGATLTAGEFLLARPLAQWCRIHPEAEVSVTIADTAKLLSQLNNGSIDCALVEGIFDSSRYSYRHWSHERMLCVTANTPTNTQAITPVPSVENNKSNTSAKPPKTNQPKIQSTFVPENKLTFTDLLSETLVIREKGSGSRAILEAALARQNLTPQSFSRVIEVESLGMARELTAGGLGITFAYEPAVAPYLNANILRKIPLQEEGLQHDICFVWSKETLFEERFVRLFTELHTLYMQTDSTATE